MSMQTMLRRVCVPAAILGLAALGGCAAYYDPYTGAYYPAGYAYPYDYSYSYSTYPYGYYPAYASAAPVVGGVSIGFGGGWGGWGGWRGGWGGWHGGWGGWHGGWGGWHGGGWHR
jgi:hypothetical protein